MFKRFLAVMLVVAALVTCFVAPANALLVDGGTCGNNLTWTVDSSGTLTISGTGSMYHYYDVDAPWYDSGVYIRTVVIKSGVTSIGQYAFWDCTDIVSVTIPSTVTIINEGAFADCTSLATVNIPGSVTSIGAYAFAECTALTKVTIPNGVTVIHEGAFAGCTALTTVNIPGSVTNIGSYAFAECTALTKVTIPGSVANIGSSAFAACTALNSLTISNGVKTIGQYAFTYCSKLPKVTIPASVNFIGFGAFAQSESMTSIQVNSNNAFYSSDSRGVLFNKNKTNLLQAPGGISGSYTIPSSVKVIEGFSFYECGKLTSVSIPNSVTDICYDAFEYSGLRSLTIPSSVKRIAEWAFSDCDSLTNLTIPGTVTKIEGGAFSFCDSLSSVTVGHGIKELASDIFYESPNLTSVFIPTSITTINSCAFSECPELRTVSYGGTEAQWNAISIDDGNETLTYALKLYNQFPDVKPGDWHYNAVQFAVKKGYFSGHGNGTFGPSQEITRQDFAVVLARIAKADLSKYSGKTGFSDVASNTYYAKAIHWASSTGIITGYSNGKFGVGDKLTREQLVTILYRYAAKKGANTSVTAASMNKLNSFSDIGQLNPSMKTPFAWALQNKVISGMSATKLGPKGNATRAQVAAILMNINSYKVIPGI